MDWKFILLLVLAIAALIVGIEAIRLAKRRQLVWAFETKLLIGRGTELPELKLTFNDIPVDNVYRTAMIFFNKGNEPIDQRDLRKKS
jgi:hypothetical protein